MIPPRGPRDLRSGKSRIEIKPGSLRAKAELCRSPTRAVSPFVAARASLGRSGFDGTRSAVLPPAGGGIFRFASASLRLSRPADGSPLPSLSAGEDTSSGDKCFILSAFDITHRCLAAPPSDQRETASPRARSIGTMLHSAPLPLSALGKGPFLPQMRPRQCCDSAHQVRYSGAARSEEIMTGHADEDSWRQSWGDDSCWRGLTFAFGQSGGFHNASTGVLSHPLRTPILWSDEIATFTWAPSYHSPA